MVNSRLRRRIDLILIPSVEAFLSFDLAHTTQYQSYSYPQD
jgi:hypothetical protein